MRRSAFTQAALAAALVTLGACGGSGEEGNTPDTGSAAGRVAPDSPVGGTVGGTPPGSGMAGTGNTAQDTMSDSARRDSATRDTGRDTSGTRRP